MIARVLDIPDEPAARAAWLDRQIAGPALHELVAELAAVHGSPEGRRAAGVDEVAAWLGDTLPGVLARGTAALDSRRLGELLRSPGLLPGLQELVFVEGDEHWRRIADEVGPAVGFSGHDLGRPAAAPAGPPPQPLPTPTPGPRRRTDQIVRITAALAASVLVAVGAWSLLRPGLVAPWGWNRADAFVAAAPDAYLERLATGAAEWSSVAPATEPALAERLRGMIAGCDRLLAAPHEPLAAADREWLVERCRAWRGKFAGQLAALAESHDVAAVRREADATVEKLTAALHARAEEVRQRHRAA